MTDQTNRTRGDARLDRLMAEAMAERAEAVYAEALSPLEMTERIAGRSRQAWFRPGILVTRSVLALGGVAVVVLAASVALNSYADQPEVGGPTTPAPLPTTPDAWSRASIDAGPDAEAINPIVASRDGLLAVAGLGPTTQLFASTDGRTWTRVPADQHPLPTGDRAVVVGTDRGFLMVGKDVWSSEDGFAWQPLATSAEDPDLRAGTIYAAAVGGPGLVAVGSNNTAWYSKDGSDWALAEVPPPPAEFVDRPDYPNVTVDLDGIAVAGDKLVAWGWAGADNGAEVIGRDIVMASSDGRTWSTVLPEVTTVVEVAGGPDGFLAIGVSNSGYDVWSSPDGQAWQRVASDAFDSRRSEADPDFETYVSTLAATGAGYVAVGNAATGQRHDCVVSLSECPPGAVVIWTSADGSTWSELATDDRFSSRHLGVAFGARAETLLAWGSHFLVGGAHDGDPAIWISDPVIPASGGATSGGVGTAAPAAEPTEPAPASASHPAAFAGSWEATDAPPDGSHLTMELITLADGTFDVTILDDLASVCNGASSAMTGIAEARQPGTIVIAQPEYLCDDGSQARALSPRVPPLEDQLKDMAFHYDSGATGCRTRPASSGTAWTRRHECAAWRRATLPGGTRYRPRRLWDGGDAGRHDHGGLHPAVGSPDWVPDRGLRSAQCRPRPGRCGSDVPGDPDRYGRLTAGSPPP